MIERSGLDGLTTMSGGLPPPSTGLLASPGLERDVFAAAATGAMLKRSLQKNIWYWMAPPPKPPSLTSCEIDTRISAFAEKV